MPRSPNSTKEYTNFALKHADYSKYNTMGAAPIRGFEPLHLATIKFYEQKLESKAKTLFPTNFAKPKENGEIEFSVQTDEMEEAGELLAKYNQAIRDYEEMAQRPRLRTTSENNQGQNTNEFGVLEDAQGWVREIRNSSHSSSLATFISSTIYLSLRPELRSQLSSSRRRPAFDLTDGVIRGALGLASGVALLVPMIIMTFKRSREVRIVVVCVAVSIFAVTVAATSASRESIVFAVSAYAAVMVVYIGSATSNGND